MGLCKCPKRKVTNQFCYEHRVNVCEYCVVQNHPKCVVQSYLLWLQDSDYSPECVLCKKNLSEDECARLSCYHVFHWDCLDEYVRDFPDTTAPAGYKCPSCSESILPKQNLVSPVADALREKLSTVNWGRIGLGLPLSSEDSGKPMRKTSPKTSLEKSVSENQSAGGSSCSSEDIVVHMEENLHQRNEASATVPRRNPHGTAGEKVVLLDEDESKYRRRYGFLRLSLWLKFLQNQLSFSKRGPRGVCKAVILVIGLFCLLCVIFSFLGNAMTSDDPAFELHNDPNVRFN
uniref:Zinc finger protein-like 1 homolog n=1 Tax=Riptortus pedestris TaxID=329032 RepID=R4WTK4_RIPPE|nr:zinc finger protein-like 1 homolog [Riptortus pedestris]